MKANEFVIAVDIAGNMNPYIMKNILPIPFNILISTVPLKVVVLNIIDITTKLEAMRPIISILFM